MMSWKRRHRRMLATCLALFWVVGLEALPALHLGAHDADHTHEPGGMIVRVKLDEHAHRHADGTIHGAHVEAIELAVPKPLRLEQLAFRTPEPNGSQHAASGIAHHAVALQQPAPPLIAPLPVDRAWVDISTVPAERPDALVLARPNARGPPV